MYNPMQQWIRYEALLLDIAMEWQQAAITCNANLMDHQLAWLTNSKHRRCEDQKTHPHHPGPCGAWWLENYGNRAHDVDVEHL